MGINSRPRSGSNFIIALHHPSIRRWCYLVTHIHDRHVMGITGSSSVEAVLCLRKTNVSNQGKAACDGSYWGK